MSVLDFLNPVQSIAKIADDIIGKFVADPQQKAAAQLALYEAQTSAAQAVLDAQQRFADAQAKVVVSEAQSASWIARNWRPILMLVFTYIIAHNYVIAPIFGIGAVPIPDRMWSLLELGIGGYIGGRSLEKVAPSVVAAIKS